ncbi:hypothetical protein AB0J52_07860 [Spirillospora sp. NPDC049652]
MDELRAAFDEHLGERWQARRADELLIAVKGGRHLRVYVIDGEVVSVTRYTSADGRFTSNHPQGGTTEPCRGLHPEAEELAVQAAATGMLIAAVDVLFRDERAFVLCEINGSPGWERTNPAVPDAIARCVAARVRR